MLVVMYSLPWNFNHSRNWIGVGIFPEGDTSSFFQKMYYESETFQFKRKDFYYDVDALEFENDEYVVRATSGNDHHPKISVEFHKK